MTFSALIYFYGRRLRSRAAQELLAGVGIAIGVALVFAVQVANSSITEASAQIEKGVVGNTSLQLLARGSSGFSEEELERVRRLAGVAQAAPILEQTATIVGRDGRNVAVDLASASPSLLAFEGRITRSISLHNLSLPGVILPSAVASALGLPSSVSQSLQGAEGQVVLQVRGRAQQVRVIAVLGPESIGAMSDAMVAVAPLWFVQRITGLTGQVTRILITTRPGQDAKVKSELNAFAKGRLTIAPADEDVKLLQQAAKPNSEATGFFVLVSAMVGLLLAFNAMLLTVPERRRMIADLRMQGVRRWQLIQMLVFQALCLGIAASLLGLLVGDVLARTLFHTTPSYLTPAFLLGTQTVIGKWPVVISLAGGVGATCVASAPPLFDLRRGRAVDAVYFEDGEPGQALKGRAHIQLFLCGVALALVTSGVLLIWPSAVVVAMVGLAVATLLAVPLVLHAVLSFTEIIAAQTARLNMLTVAVRALRATTVRSLALAATGAIAVFGCVVAEDSHNDLLHGLYSDYKDYLSTANVWVVNPNDDLATMGFQAGSLPQRIAAVAGVASVRSYQGGFLDFDGRRVWLIARSSKAPTMIPASQLEEGNLISATARLRRGGWITVSKQLAEAHHAHVGGLLTLPTPTGLVGYRIAAMTSNLGWSSGAIILNSSDYQRAWGTLEATAIEVSTQPQANTALVKHAIAALVGSGSALQVQSDSERNAQADALARQGLSRMSQISLLLMIAAALAMAAAMGAGIWQRRSTLASLRMQSFSPHQLRSILAYESLLVLFTGGLTGAIAGIYGHLLCDRFLRLTTGFPAPFSIEGIHTLQTIVLIVLGATIALASPLYAASRVSPQIALEG